eukprot:1474560-Lingulodinium_polyedra.AAC.1
MLRVASSGLSGSTRASMASPSRVTNERTALVSGWTYRTSSSASSRAQVGLRRGKVRARVSPSVTSPLASAGL